MHLDGLVTDLALILCVAAVVTIIFKKLKQPVVLGYIVAGFLISPNFVYVPTIVEQANISVWADLGVIFLMFGLGLEFSFKKITTVGGSAFTIAVTVMLAMVLIGSGVGSVMGWSRMDCIFLGGMLSMSSTMIILKAFEDAGLRRHKFADLVLSALVIEDIAGIFMLVILSTISVSRNVSGADMVGEIIMLLAYLVIWLLLGIYIIPSLLKVVSHLLNDEMLVILSLGICLGMVIIANLIGFSSALGAFMAGSILAGTIQSVRIEIVVKPIKDFFGAIFFVSVGMMIEPELMVKYIVPIAILSIVVIAGQILFSTIGILLSGQSLETAIKGGFSMCQIGEFSFIVATLGMNLGVISNFLYPVIVCVSVITSFITPSMIKMADPVYRMLDNKLPRKIKLAIRKYTSDNQFKNALDDDWNDYISKVVLRTIVCSSALFVIYWTGTRYIAPHIREGFNYDIAGRIAAVLIILACMVPFANIMHNNNSALWVKLWVKHRSNRLPLITLRGARILIAAIFMALTVRHFFNVNIIALMAVSIIPIYYIIKWDFMNGVTINMENRFIANFSQRTLERQRIERGNKPNVEYRWLNESLNVAEVRVTNENFNMTVEELNRDRNFFVAFIRIIRDGKIINMPMKDEIIMTGDLVHIVGTPEQVATCVILMKNSGFMERTESPEVILKDYIFGQTFRGVAKDEQLYCVPIKIKAGSDVILTSIKYSKIRKRFSATIIGIERGALTIVAPDKDTILLKGDMLWLMGGSTMLNRLIKGGYMNEN